MKIRNILIILTLFIVLMCAVSAVSAASDNAVDNQTSETDDSVSVSHDEKPVGADDETSALNAQENHDEIAGQDLKDDEGLTVTSDDDILEAYQDLGYFLDYPKTVIAHSDSKIRFGVYSTYPGISGNLSLYIDGGDEPIYNQPARYYAENSEDSMTGGNFINLKNHDFTFGNHTALLKYSGDETYRPFTTTWTFDYEYLVYSVPETVYNTFHSDSLFVEMPYDMTGNLRISIDGKDILNAQLPSGKLDNAAYIGLSFFTYSFPEMDYRQYNYTITYSNGNYPDKSITGKFNVTYDLFCNPFINVGCGETAEYTIYRPFDGTGDFLVEFDNRTYDLKVDEKTDSATLVLENFSRLGKLPISIRYQDSKYPLKEFIRDVYVYASIEIPTRVEYGSQENITLIMPYSATGELLIFKNDNLVEKVPLVNGRAVYPIREEIGRYDFRGSYNGTFAQITNASRRMFVVPKIISPSPVYVNDDYNLTMIVNDNPNSTIIIEAINQATNERKTIYNGTQTGKIFTKGDLNLKAGYHSLYLTTVVNSTELRDSEIHNEYLAELDIRSASPQYKIKAQIDDVDLSTMKSKDFKRRVLSVEILNVPYDGYGEFSLYINGKLITTSHYNDLSFRLDQLKKGNNKCTITYIGDRYYHDTTFTKTIKVYGEFKDAKKKDVVKLTLKKVKVKRSAKKLVLTATLKINGKASKNTVLKFKFKGKTYKAKTNSKGIAKATVKKSVLKKLKKGKKITYQVTYKKTTKKITVKVQK